MPEQPLIDVDPYIPTGVPATPEQVEELIAKRIITEQQAAALPEVQRPHRHKT
jgi:hypothetical protein